MYSLIFTTAGFMKTVLLTYTLLVNTLYLALDTQVAKRTVFRKHTVPYRLTWKERMKVKKDKRVELTDKWPDGRINS